MMVGRILSVNGLFGQAEFTENVTNGDLLYYRANDKKFMCQVTRLSRTSSKGLYGVFRILDLGAVLPRIWTNLYLLQQKLDGHINIGETEKGVPINLRVNGLFRHVLIAGKTGEGKTHVEICMHEEFLKLNIPSIAFDTKGEMVHLDKFDSNAIIVEDLEFEDLLTYLIKKKTVVFNLQGLSYPQKAQCCFEVLSQLRAAKENDYKQAENDVHTLRLPPIIVDIDETEIYAPNRVVKTINVPCRELVIDYAKRGGGYGLGLIVNSQRLPGLHHDVRSQCNSAIIFQVTDSGTRTVLSQLPYITEFDLNRVRDLQLGQCIVTGDIVDHPVFVNVREIKTQRAKSLNFEKMLGLQSTTQVEPEELEVEEGSFSKSMASMSVVEQGITFDVLKMNFRVQNVPRHGECVVIPERKFNPYWKETLQLQGCKVIYVPDMPGGSIYLVRRNNGSS